MIMMLFHPKKNIGREVKINGEMHKISSVIKSLAAFRIEKEKFGVVNDYDERHIQSATVLTVSLNNGESWLDIPFYQA